MKTEMFDGTMETLIAHEVQIRVLKETTESKFVLMQKNSDEKFILMQKNFDYRFSSIENRMDDKFKHLEYKFNLIIGIITVGLIIPQLVKFLEMIK